MKSRVYEAFAKSILLYGLETWSLKVAVEKQLEDFDYDCHREILRYRHASCTEARHQCQLDEQTWNLLQRLIRCFSHADR